MGERGVRNAEATGSIPVTSIFTLTKPPGFMIRYPKI